jgi:hypothetical protein
MVNVNLPLITAMSASFCALHHHLSHGLFRPHFITIVTPSKYADTIFILAILFPSWYHHRPSVSASS